MSRTSETPLTYKAGNKVITEPDQTFDQFHGTFRQLP
jgi:hypothetical protein